MRRAVGAVLWWAAFLTLAFLMSRSNAGETSARMAVSVTVVRPCRISLEPQPPGASADVVVPRVDCGPSHHAERTAFRARLCDRNNREGWCLRLRELHPGVDIRTVRFD